MTENPIDLSVVILCYRSGETIVPFVQQVKEVLEKQQLEHYELVLVGNYIKDTGDSTPDVVNRLAEEDSRITSLTLEKEGMMGWDVMTGINQAAGKTVALIDGDGQMPPQDIVRLYRVLESGEFDFVKTYRADRLDGIFRKIISGVYNAIFRILFPGTPFRDINSKPKLWTRSALKKMNLQCRGWFSDGEIMLEVHRLGLSFAEIPTTFHPNEWRASFVNFRTIGEIFLSMIWYRFVFWFKK